MIETLLQSSDILVELGEVFGLLIEGVRKLVSGVLVFVLEILEVIVFFMLRPRYCFLHSGWLSYSQTQSYSHS